MVVPEKHAKRLHSRDWPDALSHDKRAQLSASQHCLCHLVDRAVIQSCTCPQNVFSEARGPVPIGLASTTVVDRECPKARENLEGGPLADSVRNFYAILG